MKGMTRMTIDFSGLPKKLTAKMLVVMMVGATFMGMIGSMPKASAQSYFEDDMESGALGWTADGFWHLVDDSDPYPNSHSPTHSWWYGQDATGNYDNGARNFGNLTSPIINLTTATSAELTFWSWYDTEQSINPIYDNKSVLISKDGGSSWEHLLQIRDTKMTWNLEVINLSAYVGYEEVMVRFFFDSYDFAKNDYQGWYIDDVKVLTPTEDTLTVVGTDKAPLNVYQGATTVVMLKLDFTADANAVKILSIRVDFTGTDDADISRAYLYHDMDNDGEYDASEPQLADNITAGFRFFLDINDGFWVSAGQSESLLVAYDIKWTAIADNTVGARIVDETFIQVAGADIVSPSNLPTESTKSKIIEATLDTLTVVGTDRAPIVVYQADMTVLMMHLNLTVDANTAIIDEVRVELSGTGTQFDIAQVELYHDKNNNGSYEPGIDEWLATSIFVGLVATIDLLTAIGGLKVVAGTPTHLLITYDIAMTAIIGSTVGAFIQDETYITVQGVDSVSPLTFPFYSTNSTISALHVDDLSVTGVDKAPVTVEQGQADVVMEQLKLNASAFTVELESITLNLTGTVGDTDISGASLCHDVNDNDNYEPGTDIQLGSIETFSMQSLDFTDLSFVITAGTNESVLILYTISAWATVSNTAGVEVANITVAVPDLVLPFAPIQSSDSTIGPNALTTTGTDKAPGTAGQGQQDVVMEQLTLSASNGHIALTSIKVNLSGTGSDTNVSAVRLYHDVDDNGDYNSGIDVKLGTEQIFVAGGASFTGFSFQITAGNIENFLIVFDISTNAIVGCTVGVRIEDSTYLALVPPDIANAFAPIQSTDLAIVPNTLTVAGADRAPSLVHINQAYVVMEQLTLSASGGSITLTAIKVDLSGTGADGDILGVRLYHDVNDNGTYEPSDEWIGTQLSFIGGSLTFTGLSFKVATGTDENLLITFDIAPVATVGNTVGVRIEDSSYIGVAAPDTVVGFSSIQSTNSSIAQDDLTMIGSGKAPIMVSKGQTDVLMAQLTLNASSNSIALSTVRLDLIGTGGDANVSAVRLYHDINDNDTYEPGTDIQLGIDQTFLGGSLNFTGLSFPIAAGINESLLIVLDVSANAVFGNTIGIRILDNTYIGVQAPDAVNAFPQFLSGLTQIFDDTTTPTSTMQPLPQYMNTSSFDIDYNAFDADSGVQYVELYYRKDGGLWIKFALITNPDGHWTSSPINFTVPADGFYELFVVGTDNANNVEVKGFPEANTTVDTTPPSSQVVALPTYQNSLTFDVGYTANDMTTGVQHVELYWRKDGTGGYSKYSPVTNPTGYWSSSPIGFTALADGFYEFYLVATDNVDNVENAPLANDTWTVVDTQAPTSSANALPVYATSFTFGITYTAQGGAQYVELYFNKDEAGWIKYASAANPEGRWLSSPIAFTAPGEGYYKFYTIATDIAGNIESAPGLPNPYDAYTFVDQSAPISRVNILPGSQISPTFDIAYAASDMISGVQYVELYYNKDSSGWIKYVSAANAEGHWMSSPIAFTAPADGFYEFYTVATDYAGNIEIKSIPEAYTDVRTLCFISGTVKDKSGNPIEGANVTVVGTEWFAITDGAGRYTISNMLPGTYDLKILKEGYESVEVTDIVLEPGETRDIYTSLSLLGELSLWLFGGIAIVIIITLLNIIIYLYLRRKKIVDLAKEKGMVLEEKPKLKKVKKLRK